MAAAAATADALPGEFSGAPSWATGLRAKGLLPAAAAAEPGRCAGEGARLMLPAVAATAGDTPPWWSVKAGPGTGVTAPRCTRGDGEGRLEGR